jgi:hypothetical protein
MVRTQALQPQAEAVAQKEYSLAAEMTPLRQPLPDLASARYRGERETLCPQGQFRER